MREIECPFRGLKTAEKLICPPSCSVLNTLRFLHTEGGSLAEHIMDYGLLGLCSRFVDQATNSKEQVA